MLALLLSLLLQSDDLAAKLRELDGRVLPEEQPKMLSRDARLRIQAANRRESEAWAKVTTHADWQKYQQERIRALEKSLGVPSDLPSDLRLQTTRTLEGEGYRILNLVYQSRPGILVPANLYSPKPERASMPGILIVHSHHNPKTQGELQDMGVTWARQGCLVLVMDQLGHGERRQHGFPDAASYPGSFRVGRQDYFFRYTLGFQLQLAGESLMGWMVRDLKQGVDVLLERPGIDPKRIILLGSVAGGGDPAAVAAALDPRIAAVAPFNFGGPQPESPYPLPEDAESGFNYAGGGSWESTRNLRLSARDGFLPWVIVGSVAPRLLIYGHEFSWDRDHDPVWKRLEKIYDLCGNPGGLASATGRGTLKGQPPESTHCNNIGPVHREGIHAALEKWFRIPGKESQDRRPASELLCFTAETRTRPVHEVLKEGLRAERLPPDLVRAAWSRVLGALPKLDVTPTPLKPQSLAGIRVERFKLETEGGIVIPAILLLPKAESGTRFPVVVGIAQGGKQEFLHRRAEEIAALLKGGAAVCLPDLRGTGETRPGGGRGRNSEGTDIAASELMLGRTMVGLRLLDLRAVLWHLAYHPELDRGRIAIWGDSFAKMNPSDRRFEVPIDADNPPEASEPMGGVVALLGALFDNVRAVYVRGGLVSYAALLDSPYLYAPYDFLVPGAARGVDLPETAAALAPIPVRMEDLVDGWNRRVPKESLAERYTPAMLETAEPAPAWLLRQLNRR